MNLRAFAVRCVALVLALIFAGCAGVEYLSVQPSLHPAPGKALVVFYREDRFLHSEVQYKVRDGYGLLGQQHIGGLKSGTYFTYQADPGQHTFTAGTEVMNILILNVQAGRTYYVRGGVHAGVLLARPDFREVPAEVGRAALRDLRPVQVKPKKS